MFTRAGYATGRQELPIKDPVLTKLQADGVQMSALHNHVFHESPRVMYMHIHAMGDS
ncbi:MAG TPA: DUF1259 domain-containing protein [Pyrinomonadaceae bacterium]|nr:DUF1259 domain-containing protein [Pyrinomonadaceae bacterium]